MRLRSVRTRLFLTTLLMSLAPSLFAIDLKPEEIRGKGQQSPVTILQNRYFTKALRPELGVSYGTITNEAYTDTTLFGFRGAMFLNEWIGVELQSMTAKVADSDDRKALRKITYYRREPDGSFVQGILDPEVNEIKKVMDVSAILAPFYGKLNLADFLIVYSDVYFTAGMSRVSSDQGDLNGINYGAGQRFYWAKNLSMRIDFKARTYTETRNGADYRKNTYSVDFGLSYYLF
ncbi:outer membrane beta-barrel domain-containing protein [Oligoflexus tunisiensis]|uniref:outer membrane beta-barrel domain-containing protein n=1 Tax=Oligoflexus tunisiensis TaxID=708132 RepID=UPI00114CE7ED|nr:outer membrane beta-barrel domain-containing protein [Oligoflexus tunisiensis]